MMLLLHMHILAVLSVVLNVCNASHLCVGDNSGFMRVSEG